MDLQLDDMVVTTPERVAFSYTPAGLGTRFVAQVIDLLLLGMLAFAGFLVLFQLSVIGVDSDLLTILLIFWVFGLLFGYFAIQEAVWSGQTLGKRVMRLRVVGVRGEPLTPGQALIRNLVRIADWLPLYYGIGAVAVFASPRQQRLGDMVAGTVVVRERQAIAFGELLRLTDWAEYRERQEAHAAAPYGATTPAAAAPARRWSPRLDPALRRFVVAYAGRRAQLSEERRRKLAAEVEPALRAVLPQLVTQRGPLAALDELATDVDPS